MHRNHLRPLTADFNSGHDLGRVNFRGKKSLSSHSNAKSLYNNETLQSALGGKQKKRSRVPFNSSNEIYDYGAKVEWGSIDHEDRGWTRRSFRFGKRGNRRRFYWLWGTLNSKGGFLATPSQVVQVEATLEDCPLDQFSAAFLTRISSHSSLFFAYFISSRVMFSFFNFLIFLARGKHPW